MAVLLRLAAPRCFRKKRLDGGFSLQRSLTRELPRNLVRIYRQME